MENMTIEVISRIDENPQARRRNLNTDDLGKDYKVKGTGIITISDQESDA